MSGKVLAIIAGVVVIGGGAFVFLNQSGAPEGAQSETGSEAESMTSEENDAEEVDIPNSGRGSFAELLALGGNATCEFTYTEPQTGSQTDGRVYIADNGKLFRGDFTMQYQGQNMESHVIRDGSKGYTWSQTPYGDVAFLFAIEDDEDIFSGNEDEASFDYNQEFDYSCERWRVDSSRFVPPSNIQFTDMTATMQQIESTSGSGSDNDVRSMQCAACEQVGDASAKAQCKQALGC